MKAKEAIAIADEIFVNMYPQEQKFDWLNELDGKIFIEICKTHEGFSDEIYPEGGHVDDEEELIAPAPYADGIYINYLLAKIAVYNSELTRYGQYAELFNAAYMDFENYINRTHKPKSAGTWRF